MPPDYDRMSTSPPREEIVDVRRSLTALRRSVPLMVAIVVSLTGTAIVASLFVAKTYSAEAQIIVDSTSGGLTGTDVATQQRELVTLQTLVTSPAVLDAAARRVDRSSDSLTDTVTASVDQDANLIHVTAVDRSAAGSARIANAVASAFISSRAAIQRSELERAQRSLSRQINVLRARGGSSANAEEINALRERAAEVSVAQASAGSELQLARAAEIPDGPSSPEPVRNGILALFLSVFLAVLAGLAREQLRPGLADQREVSKLLGLPVLAQLPEKRGLRLPRQLPRQLGAEMEGYRTLSASLRLALPPTREHVMLVTSALHAEGKTTVADRIGSTLALAEHRTLLVSADMRWPRLDAVHELSDRPGVSNLLARQHDRGIDAVDVRELIVTASDRGVRGADILPAGTMIGDGAAALLGAGSVQALFDAITELEYTYVVVDAPPLLGIGDTHLLATNCDEVLIVTRLRTLKLANVLDVRDLLERLSSHPLGLVVIGGDIEASPYYTGARGVASSEQPLMPR